MQRSGDIAELCLLTVKIRSQAARLIEAFMDGTVPPGEVRSPARFSDASAKLTLCPGFPERLSAEEIARIPGQETALFSAAFTRGGLILFETADAALEEAVRLARALPVPQVGERVLIPKPGTAADAEAFEYAKATLLAYHRAGRPFIRCKESHDALFACVAAAGESTFSALSGAVRRVLRACSAGKLGGEEALLTAAILEYAEKEAARRKTGE